ncbi:MAG: hypothetical protein GY765_38110 [bacterium]|nr:hypothetical protein [bacterium]
MRTKTIVIFISILVLLLTGCSPKDAPKDSSTDSTKAAPKDSPTPPAKDTTPPRVIETFPANGAVDVDPSVTEMWVVFNEEMTDGNWSWAYTQKHEFPRTTGNAYYTDNFTKNIIPVKLEANKQYVIWINSQNNTGFKDKSGNSSFPYKFTFKTK